jgi:hypothetical protein
LHFEKSQLVSNIVDFFLIMKNNNNNFFFALVVVLFIKEGASAARRPKFHAQGLQQWAKGEVATRAPHLPL